MLKLKRFIAPLAIVALIASVATFQFTVGVDKTKAATTATKALCGDRALAFAKFAPNVSVICDDINLYLSTNSLPNHEMMVGIIGWNQQVPIPPIYSGSMLQMWKIPLKPTPATAPTVTNGIGGTGIMVDGVPLFNPVKPSQGGNGSVYTTSTDLKLLGELDTCEGHAGRGDDYHYHAAPTCLLKMLGSDTAVVGYLLDGYPIYGYNEANSKQATGLDACNGHDNGDGRGYHYHFTVAPPYSPMCYHGVIPTDIRPGFGQPLVQGMRQAGEPVNVLITKMVLNLTGTSKLDFTYQGREGSVSWTPGSSANCWNFTYVNPPPGTPGTGTQNGVCRKEGVQSGGQQPGQQQGGTQQAPSAKGGMQPSKPTPTLTTLKETVKVMQLTCVKGQTKKLVITPKCPFGFTFVSGKIVTSYGRKNVQFPPVAPNPKLLACIVNSGVTIPTGQLPNLQDPKIKNVAKRCATKLGITLPSGPQPGQQQPGQQQPGQQQPGQQQPGQQQPGQQQGPPTNGGGEVFEKVIKSSDGKFTVSSSEFKDEGSLPSAYVCNEISTKTGVSPPISWSGEPSGTKSFVLMMYNYNSAAPTPYRYSWVVFNIPGNVHEILAANTSVGTGGTSDHGLGYTSPCSPGLKGTTKQYTIRVYALSKALTLSAAEATPTTIAAAIKDSTLATAAINGKHINLTDANPTTN